MPLNAASGHSFVRIGGEPRDAPRAGKVMKQAATIFNFRDKERRIGRQRLFFKDVQSCSGDPAFFKCLCQKHSHRQPGRALTALIKKCIGFASGADHGNGLAGILSPGREETDATRPTSRTIFSLSHAA
jgi:hypothetical protein